jgi:uncharacterized membrane protein
MGKTQIVMNPLLTLILLLFFDLIWITVVMKPLYDPMIQNIQGSPLNARIGNMIIAYTTLFLFAYILIPKMDNYTDTFLLGFLAYGVFETTNLALFDKWNPYVVIPDSIWGGILMCLLRYFCQN